MKRWLPFLFVVTVGLGCVLAVGLWLLQPDSAVTVQLGQATFTLEVADTTVEQAVGLQGRRTLPDHRGMLFQFDDVATRQFWMKNTFIPLDLVWLHDGVVVGVTTNVQPEPDVADADLALYDSPVPVDQVIELPAGAAERAGIEVGDSLYFTEK